MSHDLENPDVETTDVDMADIDTADIETNDIENADIENISADNEQETIESYDRELIARIVEGAILASGETLSIKRLQMLFVGDVDGDVHEEAEPPTAEEIKDALALIQERTIDRGFRLVEVASGWRFQVGEDVAPWVNRLWDEKPQKYSRALLETIAIIAYRQPLTRGDIEDVRGVAVSSHIIKTLAEREWIKVVGQRDVPGRPSLYATTKQFLDYFGLKKLDELPTLKELQDIDSLNENLELNAELVEQQEEAMEKEQIAEAAEIETSEDEATTVVSSEQDSESTQETTQEPTLEQDEVEAQESEIAETAVDSDSLFSPENLEAMAEPDETAASLFDDNPYEEVAEADDVQQNVQSSENAELHDNDTEEASLDNKEKEEADA